jgi:hypothetical protein
MVWFTYTGFNLIDGNAIYLERLIENIGEKGFDIVF